MIKEKRRCRFWRGRNGLKKAPKYQRKAESIQRHMGCAVWCIVRYINLPPTLCRSKQTPCLLLAVSPRQYFYLSCETAIQIDEVQQHDIFCTSITLRGWATWVKSQQTITFPDISSPHSDRWWILPDKAFIIAENRECTKKKKSLFSSPPPSSASTSKSRWTRTRLHTLTVRREKPSVARRCSLAIKKCILFFFTGQPLRVQWAEGHVKWKQLFCASSDLIPLSGERLLWKWAMTVCHRRSTSFYHLSGS